MHLSTRVGLILLLVSSAIGISNCAKPGFKLTAEDLAGVCSGVFSKKPKLTRALEAQTFPAGTQFGLLLDSACLRDPAQHGALTKLYAAQKNIPPAKGKITAGTFIITSTLTSDELRTLAENDSCVKKIDRDAKMETHALPNDPLYATDQPYMTSINHDNVVENLYNAFNGINQNVTIAVVDTGFTIAHPDLADLFDYDTGGNLIGYNATDGTNDVDENVNEFHGTYVTGLAAAVGDNATGMTGVMHRNVRVLPVKVMTPTNTISLTDAAAGVIWATDNGADVINLSIGQNTASEIFYEAIQYAIDNDVVLLTSAGNGGRYLSDDDPLYPAMYSVDFEGMMTVGSFDVTNLTTSSFSNRSTTWVDLMAPGSDDGNGLLSTFPVATYQKTYTLPNSSVEAIEGTSMATPIASGVAAIAIALGRSRGYDVLASQVEELFNEGLPNNIAFVNHAKDGKRLDLEAIVNLIDTDTNLDISGTTARTAARGIVGIATHPASTSVVVGSPLNLTVTKTTASSILVNYQWYKDGVAISGANHPTLTIDSIGENAGGRYKVKLTAGTSYMTSDEAMVTVTGCD